MIFVRKFVKKTGDFDKIRKTETGGKNSFYPFELISVI